MKYFWQFWNRMGLVWGCFMTLAGVVGIFGDLNVSFEDSCITVFFGTWLVFLMIHLIRNEKDLDKEKNEIY